MKAAVLDSFNAPLAVRDVPDPVTAPGETLVRVRAVGVCGSDLKVVGGLIPTVPLPHIPGHEVAGELVEDVAGFRAGQRVAVYNFQPCGTCRYCRKGMDSICERSPRVGFERNGGLAEYLLMRPQDLVPFDDSLDFAVAAVTMDAVLSPWRALIDRGSLQASEYVVVVGAGGLGLHAIQIARWAGAHVAAIDVAAGNREEAMLAGAELALGPDELGAVREWSAGGADLTLEASGSVAGFETAIAAAAPGGRVVCCGYRPGSDFGFDSMRLAMSEISVLGSRGGSYANAVDALRAVSSGSITPRIAGYGSLSDINDFLDRLRSGSVAGRLVVRM